MKTHGREVGAWMRNDRKKAFWCAESSQYVPLDIDAGSDHDECVSRAEQARRAQHD